MGELDRLTKRAADYEHDALKLYGCLYNFYQYPNLNARYEEIKGHYTRDLIYLGNGACSEVYRMNQFVLKLHTPFKRHITLRSQPARNYGGDPKYNWFLYFKFISHHGLAGVQKFVNCSADAQKMAYKFLIEEKGLSIRTKTNCGLWENVPVIVDWD